MKDEAKGRKSKIKRQNKEAEVMAIGFGHKAIGHGLEYQKPSAYSLSSFVSFVDQNSLTPNPSPTSRARGALRQAINYSGNW